uniref:Carbohydrate sulfotransferase n=1 Tax=Saccoglossus kowalevskii TaxID=10224 RepID=A0ABM0MQV5_SACKO|nr:PREDICTED: uncharacterized protein LOC102806142 [Saccoglossus kowalevskii]
MAIPTWSKKIISIVLITMSILLVVEYNKSMTRKLNIESLDKEYRHVSVVHHEKHIEPHKQPLNSSDTEKKDAYNCWKASAKRVKLAENACRDNNVTYVEPRMIYFVVSEKYKFMFKLMPKVSSTTWKNFLPTIDSECLNSANMMELLNLTKTDYDFIGHFEHLGEDAACVLEMIGLDSIYRFPDIHAQKGNLRYTEALGSLPKDVLESLIEVYRLDYEIFGYRIPTFEEFKVKHGL